MIKKLTVFFLMVLVGLVLFHAHFVNAASTDWSGIDFTIQDLFAIITGLACWFSRVATSLMVIFIIWSGIKFMSARGDSKAYESAKQTFKHVIIGLIVILGVYVIIATVANAVGITNFSFIPLQC